MRYKYRDAEIYQLSSVIRAIVDASANLSCIFIHVFRHDTVHDNLSTPFFFFLSSLVSAFCFIFFFFVSFLSILRLISSFSSTIFFGIIIPMFIHVYEKFK